MATKGDPAEASGEKQRSGSFRGRMQSIAPQQLVDYDINPEDEKVHDDESSMHIGSRRSSRNSDSEILSVRDKGVHGHSSPPSATGTEQFKKDDSKEVSARDASRGISPVNDQPVLV